MRNSKLFSFLLFLGLGLSGLSQAKDVFHDLKEEEKDLFFDLKEIESAEAQLPTTVYIYYSYDRGPRRHYNYLAVRADNVRFSLPGVFGGGAWHVVSESERTRYNDLKVHGSAYLLADQYKAEQLLNAADRILGDKFPTRYDLRLESIRVSDVDLSYSYYAGTLFSSLTRQGYPVIVEDSFGKYNKDKSVGTFVRLDARYADILRGETFARMPADISRTNFLSKPALRKIPLDSLKPRALMILAGRALTSAAANKLADEVGKMAATRIERLFYESPDLVLRSKRDNQIVDEVYIGTKKPEVLRNFLNKIGLRDEVFRIHPTVNWALIPIKRRLEASLARFLSEQVSRGVSLAVRFAAKKAFLELLGVDKAIANAELEKDRAELKKVEQEIASAGFEEPEMLASNFSEPVSSSSATDLGGIRKLQYQRDNPEKIPAGGLTFTIEDVVALKMAEIRLKITQSIYEAVREGVEYGVQELSSSIVKLGMKGGACLLNSGLTALVGPGAVFVTGGLSLTGVFASKLADIQDHISKSLQEYFSNKAGDLVDNTNLPIPKFLKATKRDIDMVSLGDYEKSAFGGNWNLLPKNWADVNYDNPRLPTLANYSNQLVLRTRSKIAEHTEEICTKAKAVCESVNRSFIDWLFPVQKPDQ